MFGTQTEEVSGALSYEGTWNASTNSPALVSSVGTAGNYYIVSVAGATNLNGITDWGVGDWVIFNGSVWQKIDNSESIDWKIDGNTVGSEKWIGTVDNFNFPVRTNNIEIAEFATTGTLNLLNGYRLGGNKFAAHGYVGTVDISNTFIGVDAGSLTNAAGGGIDNTAVGWNALAVNNIGTLNTAVGKRALEGNTTGSGNTGIGPGALLANTTASNNLAIGHHAMLANITGDNCVSIGNFSLLVQTAANDNVAIGRSAMQNGTTATACVAIGKDTMAGIADGGYNSACGGSAMYSVGAGSQNAALGYAAGYFCSGSNNVFAGALAGYNNTGSGNVFIGNAAGQNEAGSNFFYLANSNTATPLMWADFSSGELKFNLTNFNISSLPTSNAGLATGDLYIDTAANILANGDKVVASKV